MELLKIMTKEKDTIKYPGCTFLICGDIKTDRQKDTANDMFDYESIKVYKSGVPFKPSGTTWAGRHFEPFDVFEQVINAYLLDNDTDFEFKFVCPEIKALKDQNTDTELKQIAFGAVIDYVLVCKTDEYLFWIEDICNEGCMITDKNGIIITDAEPFYTSGLCEAVENNEITFINDCMFNLDQFIKDYDIIVKEKIS